MKNSKFQISWGNSPLDIRLGAMFGVDHFTEEVHGKNGIGVHLVLGLLWVNVHASLTFV